MTLFTWLKRMGKLGLLSGSTSRTHSVPCIKLVSRWHSNLRWAIGLFMYQSLDAVDGWVDTFAPVYISAYPTVGNRHGEREWQVLWEKCLIMVCVRVSWRASIFTFFFTGCDALNTTVCCLHFKLHFLSYPLFFLAWGRSCVACA